MRRQTLSAISTGLIALSTCIGVANLFLVYRFYASGSPVPDAERGLTFDLHWHGSALYVNPFEANCSYVLLIAAAVTFFAGFVVGVRARQLS